MAKQWNRNQRSPPWQAVEWFSEFGFVSFIAQISFEKTNRYKDYLMILYMVFDSTCIIKVGLAIDLMVIPRPDRPDKGRNLLMRW